MRFRLTPRSMKLDDHEQCISSNFQRISRDFAFSNATTAKRMKIDQYCLRQRCKQLNAVFNIVP